MKFALVLLSTVGFVTAQEIAVLGPECVICKQDVPQCKEDCELCDVTPQTCGACATATCLDGGCTLDSGIDVPPGDYTDPKDPCTTGTCIDGTFFSIVIDCMPAELCDGKLMDVEGQCCPTCVEPTECSPGCPVTFLGDDICDQACNNADCGFDGGDCAGTGGTLFPTSDPSNECSPGCPVTFLEDDICDQACNNADCDFDGGDCAGTGGTLFPTSDPSNEWCVVCPQYVPECKDDCELCVLNPQTCDTCATATCLDDVAFDAGSDPDTTESSKPPSEDSGKVEDDCMGLCGENTQCIDSMCVPTCESESECCSPGEASCGNAESCVCLFDPFCCNTAWDQQCIEESIARCGLECA